MHKRVPKKVLFFFFFSINPFGQTGFTAIDDVTRGMPLNFHLNINVVDPIIEPRNLQGTFLKSSLKKMREWMSLQQHACRFRVSET